MIDEIDDLLDIHSCDCGRPWCEYFNPGANASYTKEGLGRLQARVDHAIEVLPKIKAHLEELQNDPRT